MHKIAIAKRLDTACTQCITAQSKFEELIMQADKLNLAQELFDRQQWPCPCLPALSWQLPLCSSPANEGHVVSANLLLSSADVADMLHTWSNLHVHADKEKAHL